LTNRLRITPGLRFNNDKKKLDYDQQVYGGLQTSDPALLALQRSVLSPLTYKTDVSDNNVSGQLTLSYKLGENAFAYGTFATGFKSIGLNLGGVPPMPWAIRSFRPLPSGRKAFAIGKRA
jgi:iron complex outermembrane receptor protein